ncbi:MAG: prepilin-type N-terminal cleavage/methylation domain-containing protein [Proteobacteria bacterium]|nr:prepilin-type N-terminal cleavage/methylation domain-containing protein [Pseudomonadota bacterium]
MKLGDAQQRRPRRLAGTAAARTRSAEGFTLIEVLLSMAIMAMMAALAWGSFSATARSKTLAERSIGRYQQVRTALNRIARELAMAYLSKNDQSGALHPRTRFVGKRGSKVDELTFSTLAHVRLRENARECDQSVIRYTVAPGPAGRAGRQRLLRRESPRLGSEREPEEDGAAYVVLEDVRTLRFEYYDAQAKEWREEWSTMAADGQPDRLPEIVRVVLTVVDERERERTFRTAARTFLRDPLWVSSAVD